jgi:hypothetical protein
VKLGPFLVELVLGSDQHAQARQSNRVDEAKIEHNIPSFAALHFLDDVFVQLLQTRALRQMILIDNDNRNVYSPRATDDRHA